MKYLRASVENLRRLDRGAAWTLIGNLLNILPGLLELLLLRRFGLGIWGEFLAAQAVVLVAGRVACLGLDKGLLWYLPSLGQRSNGLRRPALGAALQVFLLGLVISTVLVGPLLQILLPRSTEFGLSRAVVLAIPFFAASEVMIGALQGIQRFHYRPLLRDLGVSAFLAPIALGLAMIFGLGPISLGIGFLAGHILVAGLALTFWLKETIDRSGGSLVPSRALARYSLPIWVGESVNSANQRIAVLILSRVAASSVVGAFGVISMVWQSATLMRRAFETPLVTVTAGAPAHEVREIYFKVVSRVLTWQIPVVIVMAAAGGTILHLISPSLGTVDHHISLILLVSASFAVSAPWMAQQILAGLGHSQRVLYNSTLAALVGTGLLWLLVPLFGIIGACLAQAVAVIASGLLGTWQIRHYANLPGYPTHYLPVVGVTLVGTLVCTWLWILPASGGSEFLRWPAWVAAAVFLGLWAWIEKPIQSLRS